MSVYERELLAQEYLDRKAVEHEEKRYVLMEVSFPIFATLLFAAIIIFMLR